MQEARYPIEMRKAVDADYMAFARLFPQLQTTDQAPGVLAWLREMIPSTLMLEHDGQVVGYVFFQVLKDTGYVRHLVVDSLWRGNGFGLAAMREVAGLMRAAGCAKWCLNVEPDNHAAIQLYRRVGMHERWKSTAIGIPWTLVDQLPMPARPVSTRTVEPLEDLRIERAFGLPEGQLQDARRLGSRHLVRIVRDDDPEDPKTGIAVFDPAFPGAFPFRVAEVELARPLLAGLRAYARADFDYVRIVVEDHAALSELLIGAGAKVFLRVLHMQGELSQVQ